MASPHPPSPAQAPHYRLPELLYDIRLLDLLELCGTTVQTGRMLQLSQPTISRRYRLLADDFGLVRDRRQHWGCGTGTSAAMRLLRLGCRAHRLAAGVARIGGSGRRPTGWSWCARACSMVPCSPVWSWRRRKG